MVTGIPLRWLPDGLMIKADVIAMLGEDGRPLLRRGLPGEGRSSALVPAPFSPATRL